jgi:hypothetical protein
MECIAYSLMVIANQEATGQAEYTEYNFPKLQFNLGKILKSSAWLALAGISIFFAAVTQAQAVSAAYVRTNGSCLRVRTGPSTAYQVVGCIPNGAPVATITGYNNGFARLSTGTYVGAKWISGTSNPRPATRPSGVGGQVILNLGAKGQPVRDVQQALGGLTVDGVYGPVTASRVRQFQASNSLRVDGIVGPQTRNFLFRS